MPFLQTLGGGSALGFRSASGGAGNYTEATGGISASYHDGTDSWKVHIFKDGTNQTFNVTKAGDADLEYVVLAGGGGGGGGANATWHGGGGGGAGGLITGTTAPIVQGYTIDVGSGGNGGTEDSSNPTRGQTGSNSVAFSQTAIGGGGGGGGTGSNNTGTNGGSGGGSGVVSNTAQGTSGQGNNGGQHSSKGGDGGDPYGAGGGGKGSVGTDNFGPNGPNNPAGYSRAGGGNGGTGWDTNFMGVSTRLAEGGGAAGANHSGGWGKGGCAGGRANNQPGGWGGGRHLGTTANYAGDNSDGHMNGKHGIDGTGMGGGGGWGGSPRGNGARGGNGIVIVKYPVQPYTGIGSSSGNPATSAQAIKNADSTVMSGFYWIKPSGYNTAHWVYCDMDHNGGGWMHVATFQDDPQQDTTYPREVHPWGYYLHRANNNNYTSSSSHGGRFTDNDYDEFLDLTYPAAFTSNFKHPHLYQSAPFTQVLMRDQGLNLRNVWRTNTFTQVSDCRDFFGNGTNMWVDQGTQRNSGGGGFRRLGVTSYSVNDDVFQNCSTVYIGFGEPSGVEEGNQDRSMITPQGLNSQSVSATQGIGVSRADGSGYQRYRNIDNQFRDEPGGISSNYMYTMWIR